MSHKICKIHNGGAKLSAVRTTALGACSRRADGRERQQNGCEKNEENPRGASVCAGGSRAAAADGRVVFGVAPRVRTLHELGIFPNDLFNQLWSLASAPFRRATRNVASFFDAPCFRAAERSESEGSTIQTDHTHKVIKNNQPRTNLQSRRVVRQSSVIFHVRAFRMFPAAPLRSTHLAKV